MPSPLAISANCAVAARTWETLPAADSISGCCIVWMLSIITKAGRSDWMAAAIKVTSVSLCSKQITAGDAEPLRPQFDLRRRLFPGNVQRGSSASRKFASDLGQEGAFADARFAANQRQCAAHDAAAQDTVKFADAG